MNEQLLLEPTNSLGQTPLDQCFDAFNEALDERGIELDQESGDACYDALKYAIRMWEFLRAHSRGRSQ